MYKKLRRTKIVATLGPATDFNNNLEKIIVAGANVVRMNFSHGTPENNKLRADKVREITKKLGCYVAILCDLQGPKIRISSFKEGKIFLNVSDKFLLDANLEKDEGNQKSVGIDYKKLPKDVSLGDILLLDDGRIQLKVLEVKEMKVLTEVIVGGLLSSNKGINKLGGGLSAEALTKKDIADIVAASKIGADYLAISFPRCGDDINHARRLARDAGCNAKIIAKMERAEAVCNQNVMDSIILASDVVMVARGDLGVEIGDPELVSIQKTLIRRARQLNRAVITATQMMESMINNPIPTRAEVMDVANAVLDGTDAVMLSAETAEGKYPVETVSAVNRICLGAEKIPSVNVSKHRLDIQFNSVEETIAMSAMYAANHLKGVTAIITMTESEKVALMTSRISSGLPIFAMSSREQTLNLTSLYRGVTPIYFKSDKDSIAASIDAVNLLHNRGYLSSGDIVIITHQSDIIGTVDTTNTTRIMKVK